MFHSPLHARKSGGVQLQHRLLNYTGGGAELRLGGVDGKIVAYALSRLLQTGIVHEQWAMVKRIRTGGGVAVYPKAMSPRLMRHVQNELTVLELGDAIRTTTNETLRKCYGDVYAGERNDFSNSVLALFRTYDADYEKSDFVYVEASVVWQKYIPDLSAEPTENGESKRHFDLLNGGARLATLYQETKSGDPDVTKDGDTATFHQISVDQAVLPVPGVPLTYRTADSDFNLTNWFRAARLLAPAFGAVPKYSTTTATYWTKLP